MRKDPALGLDTSPPHREGGRQCPGSGQTEPVRERRAATEPPSGQPRGVFLSNQETATKGERRSPSGLDSARQELHAHVLALGGNRNCLTLSTFVLTPAELLSPQPHPPVSLALGTAFSTTHTGTLCVTHFKAYLYKVCFFLIHQLVDS